MSEAGTYARVPLGEAFDVMCNELDDIVNRMCGIEEVALAYAWMNRHSWKVPTLSERGSDRDTGMLAEEVPQDGRTGASRADSISRSESAGRLGDGVAVGQAAGSGSAATNGEPERAALSPSLVGEPPSPSGRENPEASLGTGESRKHGGGSPTRHLAAVPEEAA